MADNRGSKPVVHTKKHLARLERERRQTRLILGFFIVGLLAAAGLLIYGYLDIKYFQLQKPVAKVGDKTITAGEFQVRAKVQREQLLTTYQQYYFYQQYGLDVSTQLQQIQSQLDDTQTLGQNVIDAMIDDELIRQESAKRGITVSDQELEDAIRAAENYYPNGTPTPAPTATEVTEPTDSPDILKYVTATSEFTATPSETPTLEVTATQEANLTPSADTTGTVEVTPSATATLEPTATATATIPPTPTLSGSPTPTPTSTPYTLEGFQQRYADKLTHFAKYGLTEAQYREFFRTDLLRTKLYNEVTKDVPHTQEQVWARHILVKDETEALAVIEELKNGQ
ncbi:MAG TPA: SurA N-terminal domain-containing protein, partial [Anaerolineales bacterium]